MPVHVPDVAALVAGGAVRGGSVVADGSIRAVRGEITAQPLQVLVRCDKPHLVAAKAFELAHVVEAKIIGEATGVLLRTTDAQSFFPALARIILTNGVEVETVTSPVVTVAPNAGASGGTSGGRTGIGGAGSSPIGVLNGDVYAALSQGGRQALRQAMRMMGDQFVLGTDIQKANTDGVSFRRLQGLLHFIEEFISVGRYRASKVGQLHPV